jgi:Zn-dependent protease
MNLLTVLLILVALAGGTKLLVLSSVWLKIRRLRLRPARVEVCDSGDLPNEIDPLFELATRHLEELDFVFSHAQWTESVVETEGRRPCQVFHHPWSGTYAAVCPPLPGTGERAFQVGFSTAFEDGTVVATFDGVEHLALSLPPCWESYDHRLNDLDRQWEHHEGAIRDRLTTLQTISYSPAELAAREEAMLAATLGFWEQEGWIAPAAVGRNSENGGNWRVVSAAAWSFAREFVAENHRIAKTQRAERIEAAAAHKVERSGAMPVVGPAAVTAGRPPAERISARWPASVKADAAYLSESYSPDDQTAPTGCETQPEREAQAAAMAWEFEYLREAKERLRRPVAGRALVFLVSTVLFTLALGWYASWRLVGFIFAAVLIHELGHLVGMIAFGYKDRQILFLPFLGAATVGRNPGARAWQRTVVYLLGPVPGLILGVACLIFFYRGGASWWLEFGIVALVLNYLNLLPFVPLDGGRLVETLILGRFPRAQAIFLGVGALAFAWVAWRFADPVLGVIALILAAALPAKWRWAAAVRRIAPQMPSGAGRPEKLKAVFETLCDPPFEMIPAAARIGMADGILEHLEARRPTLATAVAGTVLYGALLIVPFTLATPYLFPGGDTPVVEELQEMGQEAAQEAAQNPQVVDQASFLLRDGPPVPSLSREVDATARRRGVE